MFVLTATFHIKPNQLAAFLPLMLANARASLNVEPECKHFDVTQGNKDPITIFLYEVYTDEDAFKEHLTTPHFNAFDTAIADMVAEKSVETYTLLK